LPDRTRVSFYSEKKETRIHNGERMESRMSDDPNQAPMKEITECPTLVMAEISKPRSLVQGQDIVNSPWTISPDEKTLRQVIKLIRDPSSTAHTSFGKRPLGEYANYLAVERYRSSLEHKRNRHKSSASGEYPENEDPSSGDNDADPDQSEQKEEQDLPRTTKRTVVMKRKQSHRSHVRKNGKNVS